MPFLTKNAVRAFLLLSVLLLALGNASAAINYPEICACYYIPDGNPCNANQNLDSCCGEWQTTGYGEASCISCISCCDGEEGGVCGPGTTREECPTECPGRGADLTIFSLTVTDSATAAETELNPGDTVGITKDAIAGINAGITNVEGAGDIRNKTFHVALYEGECEAVDVILLTETEFPRTTFLDGETEYIPFEVGATWNAGETKTFCTVADSQYLIDESVESNNTFEFSITAAGPDGECTPGETESCQGTDVGICDPGTRTCTSLGSWGDCEGVISPTDEICDNELDDDCDGEIDEIGCVVLCDPEVDTNRTCGPGTDIGICQPGTEICLEEGYWGECEGTVYAEDEVCYDDLDNDCDGETNEGCEERCFQDDQTFIMSVLYGGLATYIIPCEGTVTIPTGTNYNDDFLLMIKKLGGSYDLLAEADWAEFSLAGTCQTLQGRYAPTDCAAFDFDGYPFVNVPKCPNINERPETWWDDCFICSDGECGSERTHVWARGQSLLYQGPTPGPPKTWEQDYVFQVEAGERLIIYAASYGGSNGLNDQLTVHYVGNMQGDCTPLCVQPRPECIDEDYDGYFIDPGETGECGELDCQDNDPMVHPNATEICDDGIDNDCDGLIDEVACNEPPEEEDGDITEEPSPSDGNGNGNGAVVPVWALKIEKEQLMVGEVQRIWVEDTLTGENVPGVDMVISNGEEVAFSSGEGGVLEYVVKSEGTYTVIATKGDFEAEIDFRGMTLLISVVDYMTSATTLLFGSTALENPVLLILLLIPCVIVALLAYDRSRLLFKEVAKSTTEKRKETVIRIALAIVAFAIPAAASNLAGIYIGIAIAVVEIAGAFVGSYLIQRAKEAKAIKV